jgi:L-alanine-DL-glutamate epimerase-like enolase superfamily enzyme
MFRWIIGDEILQVVRPDQFYFGGMIRSVRVARMAEVTGTTCIPHLSGCGLGYLYAMHYLSAIPNAGAFNPSSKDENPPVIPVHSETSSLEVENGRFRVPTGPGLGVEIDPAFLDKHSPLVPVISE